MSRLVWMLRQLFPLTYRTTYTQDGERRFAIWRMWFGRCFDVADYAIKET